MALVGALGISALGEVAGEPGAPDSGPDFQNVVLITLDTTRADALGAYGQIRDTTPNLDRMAAQGSVFDQVVSSSPLTLPSHASLFTAKQPYEHGVRGNVGYALPGEHRTLAEVLRESGYQTGAEIAATVMSRSTAIAQGFGQVRDAQSNGVELKKIRVGGKTVETRIRPAADIARHGIEFIRTYRYRSFFLWLHFFDAHSPRQPPARFAARFPDSPYLGEVAYQDEQVGRVLDQIERLSLRDKTLVVVTADHGESVGEHGEPSHGFFVYESTIRVPLIFWGPAELAGRRVSSLVRSIDIAPTVLALLGKPQLADTEGVSLAPLLRGTRADLELSGYGESLELHDIFGLNPLRFVRQGRWKYIHKVNPELYDLHTDPHERTNVAAREPQRIARLRARLRQRLAGGPRTTLDATSRVDDATRANLAALGYLGSGATSEPFDELASLELAGEDPASKVSELERLGRGQGAVDGKRYSEAYEIAGALLEQYPGRPVVLRLRGQAAEGLGRYEEALGYFREASEARPNDLFLLGARIRLLEQLGRSAEAAPLMAAFLEWSPCSGMRWKLYERFHARGAYAEQFALLEEGVERCPDSALHMMNFAWALATIPDDRLRDGARALEMAKRGMQMLGGRAGPEHFDTLAAAYAESGDFASAVRQQRQALTLLESARVGASVRAPFAQRLEAFEAGRAFRDR